MSAALARLLVSGLLVATLSGCADGVLEVVVLFGGDADVPAGTVRSGSVVVLDGTFSLAPGGTLEGPLVVLGGEAQVDGLVNADVVAIGGSVVLGPTARITGDLAVAGGLERAPGAEVMGAVTVGPAVTRGWSERVRGGPVDGRGLLGRALGLALAVVVFTRFAPRATKRLEEAALLHPLPAAALGTLALIVGIVLVVVMAFTVVLIPVSLIGLVVGVVSVASGWGVLGLAGAAVVRRWWRRGGARRGAAAWPFAAIGGAAVGIGLGALEHVPFVGGIVALLATALGIGALLLTGFGARRFVPDALQE